MRGIGLMVLMLGGVALGYYVFDEYFGSQSVTGKSSPSDRNNQDTQPQANAPGLPFADDGTILALNDGPIIRGQSITQGRLSDPITIETLQTNPPIFTQPTPDTIPGTENNTPPKEAPPITNDRPTPLLPQTNPTPAPGSNPGSGPGSGPGNAHGDTPSTPDTTPRTDGTQGQGHSINGRDPIKSMPDSPTAAVGEGAGEGAGEVAGEISGGGAGEEQQNNAQLGEGRRVAYLLDASGSTIDSMPGMVTHLGRMLDTLEPSDRFTVLFFREGEAIEAMGEGLKAADSRTVRRVWDWVQPDEERVDTVGRSDPVVALQLALTYGASEVVLLSDDTFGGSGLSTDKVVEQIAEVVGRREVKIDTVQFFYADKDGRLAALAKRFGGTYTFIPAKHEGRAPAPDAGEGLDSLGIVDLLPG